MNQQHTIRRTGSKAAGFTSLIAGLLGCALLCASAAAQVASYGDKE
jgi:hypothetical protein